MAAMIARNHPRKTKHHPGGWCGKPFGANLLRQAVSAWLAMIALPSKGQECDFSLSGACPFGSDMWFISAQMAL